MRLQDLQEYAGVTPDLVRAYLERTGWTRVDGDTWTLGERVVSPTGYRLALEDAITLLCGTTPQAILRDLNPRLRKGCPDQAARSAHPDYWLAISPSGAGFMVKFDLRRGDDPGFEVYRSSGDGRPQSDPFHDPGCSYNVSDFRGGLSDWSFWPCDAHGNKLPWPAPARDGEG